MTPEDALLDELADLTAQVRSTVEALCGAGLREVEVGVRDPGWPSEAGPPGPAGSGSKRTRAVQTRSAPPPPPDATNAWSRFGGSGEPSLRLEDLKKRVETCTRCPLAAGRRNVVFGEGQPGAILMVVGEGPGFEEDATGRPFVGEAGRMLDRMLSRVLEIPREHVYIANVIKCRPPGNRDPVPGELEACRGYLEEQLAIVRPRCILALGRHAARFLLESEQGIKTLRGRWAAWHGIPVMPTFHPAYLLRYPADKILTLQDLQMLKARLDALAGEGVSRS